MDADDELFQRLAQIGGLVERLVQAVDSGLPGTDALRDVTMRLSTAFNASKRVQLSRRDDALLADDLRWLADVAQEARRLCDTKRVRGRSLETALAELYQEALDLRRQLHA
jgi:hypothetical protein